jgi:hypothetical protein
MTPCHFLAEKIWIINESMSYFKNTNEHRKVTGLLRYARKDAASLKIVPYRALLLGAVDICPPT